MYAAIVLSAGMGSRMGLGYNKMLHAINGIPVVIMTLNKFLQDQNCGQLILVVNELEQKQMKKILKEHAVTDSRVEFVAGGSERQYSVANGLNAVKYEIVLVHDGARPFVTQEMINECVTISSNEGACIVAVPVKDTIKRVINGEVSETLNRHEMYAVQTPQAAKTAILKAAHQQANIENYLGTDEASLIEKYTDTTVKIVKGSYKNIKLTTPEDLIIATQFMKE